MTLTHTPSALGRLRVTPAVRHAALVIAGFTLLFCWVFARPILEGTYLSETDLYDYYLPVFLAPPAVWSSFELSGTPAFADPENSTFYVPHLLARAIGSWTAFIVSGYVLAACFMYAYVYRHTKSVAAAALSGVAYSLCEALLERVGHPNVVHALAWLPLLLLALDRIRFDGRRAPWTAIGAFAAAMCVLAGHPQVPVYIACLCAAYIVTGAVADRWPLRALGSAAAMAVVAALVAGAGLLPLVEVSRYTTRQSVDFTEFVSYSNTPVEMLSILFPSISHLGREASTYVGLLALVLAPIGVRHARSWRGPFWLVVAVASLLLGAGAATPLARLAYEVPLYDSFRIVARHLVFAAFALTALAGFGLAALERRAASAFAVAGSAAAVLLVMVAAGAAMLWMPQAFAFESVNETHRLPFWDSAIWFQFVMLLAAAGLSLGFLARPVALTAALLIVLAAGDLVAAFPGDAGPRGLELETVPQEALLPSVHAQRLKALLDSNGQRLMTPGGAQTNEIVPPTFSRLWRIPLADGYSSIVVERLAALAMLPRLRSGDRTVLESRNRALDVLAVKYVVFREQTMTAGERALVADETRWRAAGRVVTSRVTDRGRDEEAPGEHAHLIFENLRALPRAWLAAEVLPLTDGGIEDALFGSRLRDGRTFDPADVALVDEGQLPARVYGHGARDVRLQSIGDGVFRLRVASEGGGFLVLSETHYPGWRARIDDGPPQPVYRTNMALQGIEVPPGQHVVTFEFVSRTRTAGIWASGIGLLMVAALAAYGWRGR